MQPLCLKDITQHVLQRTACGTGGAPGTHDWGAVQPEGKPREDDADHIRKIQVSSVLHDHSGGALDVRLRSHDWHCARLRRRSYT